MYLRLWDKNICEKWCYIRIFKKFSNLLGGEIVFFNFKKWVISVLYMVVCRLFCVDINLNRKGKN